MFAGVSSANTPIYVPGATAPIQGTNAPTNVEFKVNYNQNGGLNVNPHFPEIDPDFAPRIPPLNNDFVPPIKYEQIPTVPQAKVRAGDAPPHHVGPRAQAIGSARTPHTSRPGRVPLALSSPHALLHNASFPL